MQIGRNGLLYSNNLIFFLIRASLGKSTANAANAGFRHILQPVVDYGCLLAHITSCEFTSSGAWSTWRTQLNLIFHERSLVLWCPWRLPWQAPQIRQYFGIEKWCLSCWWFPVSIKQFNVYWNKIWNIRVSPLSRVPSPDDNCSGSLNILVFVEIISFPAGGQNEENLPLSAQNRAGVTLLSWNAVNPGSLL